MKITTVLGLTLLILSGSVYASLGCLYNSLDLRQPFDNKAWHSVGCNCPCEKEYKIFDDGTCQHCGHRRDARLLEIVQSTEKEIAQAKQTDSPYADQLETFKHYLKGVAKAINKKS